MKQGGVWWSSLLSVPVVVVPQVSPVVGLDVEGDVAAAVVPCGFTLDLAGMGMAFACTGVVCG